MCLASTAFNWLHWGKEMEERGVKAHKQYWEKTLWWTYVIIILCELSICRVFKQQVVFPLMLKTS